MSDVNTEQPATAGDDTQGYTPEQWEYPTPPLSSSAEEGEVTTVTTGDDGEQIVTEGDPEAVLSEPAEDQPVAEQAEGGAQAPTINEDSRPRKVLWEDVQQVCVNYAQGTLVLDGGKPLTAGRIAKEIGKMRGGDAPSTGAVSALLNRWAEIGFINLRSSPTAFTSYTDDGVNKGLKALQLEHRANLKGARAAAKQAADLASGKSVPEPVPAVPTVEDAVPVAAEPVPEPAQHPTPENPSPQVTEGAGESNIDHADAERPF